MDRLRRALGALTAPAGYSRLRMAAVAGAIGVGALDAWFYRNWNLNPDGVSYFDIARGFAAHGPAALVSGYWSPLYPASIGVALKLLHPGADTMYPVVRLVSFLVYVACVFSFDRLTRTILPTPPIPADWRAPVALASAWALFFTFVTQATGLHLATPDIGVAALVFIVTTQLVRLSRGPRPTRDWITFGAVLGVGYWWKAILFPVGGVAWLVAAWIARRRGDSLAQIMAGAATFGVLALALAIPVSRNVGRPTFGETGRLNQLWYVNNAPTMASLCVPVGGSLPREWAGQVATDSTVLAKPLTCLTRSAVAEATLPLWFDPSPYFAATKAQFSPAQTLRAIRNDLRSMGDALREWAPVSAVVLAIALAVLVGVAARPGELSAALAFAVIPILAYLSVYVELRHIVPFILCIAVIALARLRDEPSRAAGLALVVLAVGSATDVVRRVATQQRVEAAITVHELRGDPRPDQGSAVAARALKAKGLAAGDRVATVNALWNVDWAQRAGLVVRAYVSEYTYSVVYAFDDLRDGCRRAAFVDAMRAAGIKAVILRDAPGFQSPGWFEPLGDSGYRVYVVGAADAAPAGCPATTRSSS